jgi:catalase-peroxidase
MVIMEVSLSAWRGMQPVLTDRGMCRRREQGVAATAPTWHHFLIYFQRQDLTSHHAIHFEIAPCLPINCSDGRGGADGGCQRLEPELSWADNTNLTYAHRLLEPVKQKYGLGLSWGDLMVLAGTVAIEDMGGPVLGFAAGRIDHVDNSQSLPLGPSEAQEQFASMAGQDGDLPAPLGQNTMGLIYVNPAGPMGVPDPQGAADTIRDVFGRMGMTDRENVALIGGGHTFGKCHGAGPEGPGPSPKECPMRPYPGLHGTGKGNDTVTSGFEGPWTTHPTQWDNEYFQNLLKYRWELHTGPGGNWQWRVKGGLGPNAPLAHGQGEQEIMMLTTDIALVTDPEYRKYVEEFAADEAAFSQAFAEVWYKLMNRDMGPHARLLGPMVAPPQPWQCPLPSPVERLADMSAVERTLSNMLERDPSKVKLLVRLAMNSAKTFRHTDYLGGCNGARIRFHLNWPSNKGLDAAIKFLEPVKFQYGDGLSWADVIVLAGTVAVKRLGAPNDIPFVGGRTDADDGSGWDALAFMNELPPKTIQDVVQRNALRGLSSKEYVALAFPYYPTVEALQRLSISPSTTTTDDDMLATSLKCEPSFHRWVEFYIHAGDAEYQHDFAAAFTKIMNSDRFLGPVQNEVLVDSEPQSRL